MFVDVCWPAFSYEDFDKAEKNFFTASFDYIKAFFELVVNLIKGELAFSFNIDSIL